MNMVGRWKSSGFGIVCGFWLLCRGLQWTEALNPILVRGNKMYDSGTGKRFYMKGITYEYVVNDEYYDRYARKVFEDHLASLKGHYNTIRLYNVNPRKSYRKFMQKMDQLGIYVLVSASPALNDYFDEFKYATMRKDLAPTGLVNGRSKVKVDLVQSCYPAKLLQYGKEIIKNFGAYDNTLAIVIANEVMQETLKAAGCVKQYAADLKSWMRVHGTKIRMIPLAFAAADSAFKSGTPDADVYGVIKLQGLLCGDVMRNGQMYQSIDIFLLNAYRWCEGATFANAYQRIVDWTSGAPIVIAMGEFDCKNSRKDPPRTWAMVPALFGPQMNQIFSGGTAYSYGEATQGPDAGFPMFLGGESSEITSRPSDKKTKDYDNLVVAFKAVVFDDEDAGWSDNTKCRWAPPISSSVADSNSQVRDLNGWIIEDCSKVKVEPGDSWLASTRNGAVCNSDGSPCEVNLGTKIGTTQFDMCGFVDSVSGGAPCAVNDDCGIHGVCAGSGDNKTCSCLGCYAGPRCNIFDSVACNKLTSYASAPTIIWIATMIGICILCMAFFITYMRAIARKKKLVLVRKDIQGQEERESPENRSMHSLRQRRGQASR